MRATPKELDLVEAEVAKLNSLEPAGHTENNGAAVPDAPKPGQAKPDSANGNNLRTIKFRVDPNTFAIGLERVTGISFGDSPTAVPVQSGTNGSSFVGVTNGTSPEKVVALSFATAFRQFLASVGVDFDTNNPANVGKAVVWDNRSSSLVVSAATEDMEKVRATLEIVNTVSCQVNLKVQFVSMDEENGPKALGFRWYSGTNLIGSSFPGDSRPLSGGLTPSTGVLGTGILTPPQYRATIAALSQRDRVVRPDALEITTEDNRTAQVKADETLGPILDLTPQVSTNKESIELALVATLSEFVGYETNASLRFPLPHFRSKTVTNIATVPDGQTLILGFTKILKTNAPDARSTNVNNTVTNGNLMIFVTPTLIYPDGTLVHPDFVSPPPQEPAFPGKTVLGSEG